MIEWKDGLCKEQKAILFQMREVALVMEHCEDTGYMTVRRTLQYKLDSLLGMFSILEYDKSRDSILEMLVEKAKAFTDVETYAAMLLRFATPPQIDLPESEMPTSAEADDAFP